MYMEGTLGMDGARERAARSSLPVSEVIAGRYDAYELEVESSGCNNRRTAGGRNSLLDAERPRS